MCEFIFRLRRRSKRRRKRGLSPILSVVHQLSRW